MAKRCSFSFQKFPLQSAMFFEAIIPVVSAMFWGQNFRGKRYIFWGQNFRGRGYIFGGFKVLCFGEPEFPWQAFFCGARISVASAMFLGPEFLWQALFLGARISVASAIFIEGQNFRFKALCFWARISMASAMFFGARISVASVTFFLGGGGARISVASAVFLGLEFLWQAQCFWGQNFRGKRHIFRVRIFVASVYMVWVLPSSGPEFPWQ